MLFILTVMSPVGFFFFSSLWAWLETLDQWVNDSSNPYCCPMPWLSILTYTLYGKFESSSITIFSLILVALIAWSFPHISPSAWKYANDFPYSLVASLWFYKFFIRNNMYKFTWKLIKNIKKIKIEHCIENLLLTYFFYLCSCRTSPWFSHCPT